MKNPKYAPADQEAYKARFKALTETLPHTFTGFEYDFENKWDDLTPAQRRKVLEDIYEDGSLKLWLASFGEMFFDADVASRSRNSCGEDARAAARRAAVRHLIPKDYSFGTHRVPLEVGYLEVYRRSNVELVSVKDNPIECVTPDGLRLHDGMEYKFDVLIFATGFDAGTGASTRMDIHGRGGRSLTEEWGRDIRTTMGLQIHGYPNLFTTAAPLAPSAALCNMTTCLQQQAEWISDCIKYMRAHSLKICEPTKEAEDQWVQHHEETAAATLVPNTVSWYMGSNVKGKPRRLLSYIGGVGDLSAEVRRSRGQELRGLRDALSDGPASVRTRRTAPVARR